MIAMPKTTETGKLWTPDKVARLEAMWARAQALRHCHGERPLRDPGDVVGRWVVMRLEKVWEMPGWRFQNILEPADFGLKPDRYRPWRAPRPTSAKPGTAEKLAVLAGRVEAGYELWHPGDPVGPATQSEREGFHER